MSDLTAPGSKGEVVLSAGQKVRVSTGGVATVRSDYGAPAGTVTLTANTQDFGPYGVPAKLTVTHTSGATTSYTQISDDPAALTAAQVAALGAGVTSGYVQSLRVVTFGDSTADMGTIRAGQVIDQEFCDVALGTGASSVNQVLSKLGFMQYYPAARVVGICGISGQTTTQMIAREALTPSTTRRAISDVLLKSPDVVIYRGGSINDVSGFTPATAQATIDAVFDRHMQIVDSLVSCGVRVLDEGIFGFDGASGSPNATNLAAVRAVIVSLNARWKAAIAQRDSKMVRFLDTAGITHDGGAYKPGFTELLDGTHISLYGGSVVWGKVEAEALTAWFGASAPRSYQGVNLLNTAQGSLALMSNGTTGSAIGQTPTGFNLQYSSVGTPANAAVVQRNGRRFWQVECQPDGGAFANAVMFMPFGVNSAATYKIPIVAGKQYGFEFDWFIEMLDGGVVQSGISHIGRIDLRNGSAGNLVFDMSPGTGAAVSPVDGLTSWAGHMRWSPIQISDDSSALTSASRWTWQVNFVNGGRGVRIGISSPNIVQIN